MRFLLTIITGSFLFLYFLSPVRAIVDPLSAPNNRYGIHIVDQNDLESAAKLVNSSGGDWGYVTLVIRADDRNHDKWQAIFDSMRRLHLIPLVRLATVPKGDIWLKPTPDEAKPWTEFLNSLNWVTKNRYVILFNEPNHAKEWGGEVKPHEYAEVAKIYRNSLKDASADFFVLPAGFDAAAGNGSETMSLEQYLKFMSAYDKDIFTRFDGWTSHAYPNPEFSGSIRDQGKTSLISYRHELLLLNKLGLNKPLPIFITETGWVHNEGKSPQYGAYSASKVADLIPQAFSQVWTDSNLAAITPFMLNYQDEPFDHFSWTKPGGQDVYPQYVTVQNLSKTAGKPIQIDNAILLSDTIPSILVNNSVYEIPVYFQNTGQSIWEPGVYEVVIDGNLLNNQSQRYALEYTEPFNDARITFHLQTPLKTGSYTLNVRVEKNHQPIGSITERDVRLIPPPSLLVKAQLWYRKITSGDDFTLLIYDDTGLVKKLEPFQVTDGVGMVSEIRDVIPQKRYRFVLTKAYYLPRQTFAILSPSQTEINFNRLLPVDLFPDGQLTFKDLWAAASRPNQVISLFFKR
jgi:hypothetical protein